LIGHHRAGIRFKLYTREKNMFRKQTVLITGLVAASVFSGFLWGRGTATGATDPLALAPNTGSGVGIWASAGETPEQMKRSAALNVQAYEPEDKEGGGGAPQKTIIDNDKVKVNLVSFKKGFVRPGGVKRRYDTLLVYVDPGRFTITKSGAGTPVAEPRPQRLAPGSSVFHNKESIVSEIHVDEDYRVLFIEMKK
jgi:hypothetical protein